MVFKELIDERDPQKIKQVITKDISFESKSKSRHMDLVARVRIVF